MHVIDLRSDVLLRFILFVYSYLCYVELFNRLFLCVWNLCDPKHTFSFCAFITKMMMS